MTQSRFDIGLEKFAEIDGELGQATKENLDQISPDLSRMVIEMFGDVYKREGLSLRTRELIAISTLLAMGGCEEQLRMHTYAALSAGVTKEEIVEILIQDINYCGIARVLNAAKVIKEVLA
ncbi:carboxymuconolactone decarboxylase family protein [Streptococcus tangpeifui]|uniref:carboxymuconolactone decarboxylase family protein n=1 Tax=Streptococcus tangpeifui TaxID=2709400 RepID=UPI0013EB7477|nr:carboxymuconolactone decarboxylase family protein [Streptococcus sp. ZJ373]